MTSRLNARLEKLSLMTRENQAFVISRRDGESEFDLELRIRAIGRPVVVAPEPSATIDEWLMRHAPAVRHE